MSNFRIFFGRTRGPASLRVKSGDSFAAISDKLGVTAREGEIIRLLLEGHDTKGISDKLFISEHTVKNHLHNIYKKLGIKNRIQLVRCYQAALEGPAAQAWGATVPPGGGRAVRRAALPAVLLLVALAAGLVAWRPWGRRPHPAAFPPPPALAVLDFENLSDSADLDKWKVGLPLLLATDLGQSKRLRTVGDEAVYGALRKFDPEGRSRFTREEFRRLAKEMKADYLVSGSLMTAGDIVVVTASVQDARTGETIQTERLDCRSDEDLMQKVDGLARAIRSKLSRAGALFEDNIDLDVEVLTTSSALAYKYYAEGWRYHRTGDFEQSLLMLQKAVEIDPDFAMAYRMMSADARNLRSYQREADYLRKAFELADRLPEDCRERHLIRADYFAGSESTLELAAAEFKRVLEGHPGDVVVNNNLGVLYYQIEDFESALECAEAGIRQGTSNPYPHYTKAEALWALGRGAEAERALTAYPQSFPANRLIHQVLISMLISGGRDAEAGEALDKATAVFPDPSWSYWKAGLLFQTEGAAAAREEIRRLFLMEETPWRLRGHLALALVDLATGRFADAAGHCRDGADLAESAGEAEWSSDFRGLLGQVLLDRGDLQAAILESRAALDKAGGTSSRRRLAMYTLGQVFARTGDRASIDDLMRQFEEYARAGTAARLKRPLDYFQGLVALEEGRPREAAEALERAAAALPAGLSKIGNGIMIHYYLGLAREKTGDTAAAAAAFDTILKTFRSRMDMGEVFPRAVLGKARAEDKLGRRAQAVEGYRAFLRLWADADPGRPEVAEAKARLAALAGPRT
jgi:DNA-binding CsgD family transcriptional regulator/tetratricopeptide (TPR) repeat protein